MESNRTGLFTPKGALFLDKDFSGFKEEDTEINTKMWQRRVLHLENEMEKLMEKFKVMEEIQERQGNEIKILKTENVELKNKCKELESKVEACSE